MTPLAALLLVAPLAQSSPYLNDLEAIAETVAREGAAVALHGLEWRRIVAAHRPRFESCSDDTAHVRNVMALLAELRDSHTGVTRHGAERDALPSKWDGLYGGGLWFAFEDGRFVLRGVMEGLTLGEGVGPGSALVTVDGWPAWLALEREKRRITEFMGSSSDHSLFASLGNRLLPFGEAKRLTLGFLVPGERRIKTIEVGAWGPGGKAFSPLTATLPAGVAPAEGAVSTVLQVDGVGRVGYVRVTGGMDEATARAFHAAVDRLEGVAAVLLDCRGMGGGSDAAAWEMCGRFFPGGVANGMHGRIEPSGAWQFAGPVVTLQDELMVSAAETFTWAMCETERVVSVGRPTGGWAIIPRAFQCPSGLVDYRLGVNARPTPITRRATEGIGWAPDVCVPFGPVMAAEADPVRRIGLEAVRLLAGGVPRDEVATLLGGLFGAELDEAAQRATAAAKRATGWDPAPLVALARADLEATLALELALLEADGVIAPDALGASRRFEALAARARGAKLAAQAKRLEAAISASRAEAAAQSALLEARGRAFELDERARAAFAKRHAKSALYACLGATAWRD